MRYLLKLEETFDSSGHRIEVYSVKTDPNQWPVSHVWWDTADKEARCCECSGPLVAMRKNCKHAKAVKRYVDAE